jgi:F420-non-reducing hydrogenase iron-sulfur subunit
MSADERSVAGYSFIEGGPWTPRIIAFCCNWCAYAGADLAGSTRNQYPSNVRIIRVMCSSRVDIGLILRCFTKGADGVMVLGCHIGDCHYFSGNLKEEVRVGEAHELLDLLGIDRERLLLKWISASEGELFARTVEEFIDSIAGLGPLRRDPDERQ